MTRRDSFRRKNRSLLQLLRLEDRSTPSAAKPGPIAPTANDDFTDTDGNNPVAIAVLANDAGAGGTALNPATVQVVTNPGRGTVSVNPSTGEVTYTATGFFMGTDSFRYTVKGSAGTASNPRSEERRVGKESGTRESPENHAGRLLGLDVREHGAD